MFRNTSDGNELALPATNAYERCILPVAEIVRLAAHALVCRGPRLGAALAAGLGRVEPKAPWLPFGGGAGQASLRLEGNT